MAVLECLAAARGEVVSRDDLFESVWPGAVVTDDTLTQCIVELRKAFGDTARDAKFIETIPKMGFRLVPQVLPVQEDRTVHSPGVPVTRRAWQKPAVLIPVLGAVVVGVLLYWFQAGTAPDRNRTLIIEDTQTLAVLPFVDLSSNQDQGYIADGLAEELLNRLARLAGLMVTGRTSSFYFKDRDTDLEEIRDKLNVGHVLEGSVRRNNNRLRITAQLIDTLNGYQLWSETYDRDVNDIFLVQDEIAEAVATALSITLRVGELGRLEGSTANVEAYNEYLVGQSLYRQFTRDSVLAALEHFKRATELDPGYALAWERLADLYTTARFVAEDEMSPEWETKSEAALTTAYNLAPDSPIIRNTRAFRLTHLMQWQDVQGMLDQDAGLEETTDVSGTSTYSGFLNDVDRGNEAIRSMERASRLEPLSGITAWYLAVFYADNGRIDEALLQLERARAIGDYLSVISYTGVYLAQLTGDRELLAKWISIAQEYHSPGLAIIEPMAERIDDRAAALDWLRRTYEEGASPEQLGSIVIWAAYHGDYHLALSALRKVNNPSFAWGPLLSGARQLPGFKEYVRHIGLVEYWREFGWGQHCRPVDDLDFECN
jgi:TolB-like protein